MDQFVVSARKYRPDTFESVVGQKAITSTLLSAIKNNKLAHSYLFCGPRGVGKTTCARILSKAINAANPEDLSNLEDDNMNIFELDAASNNSVDDIRKLVDQVRIPPTAGKKYKTFIIDEVHMLSSSAFNAFLKTLEEPPSYAIFILATTEKHKILPTVLSRCQTFDFQRIQISDITDHLSYIATTENIQTEPEALHIIAQKADGGLRDALSMFDQLSTITANNLTYDAVIQNLNILDYDYYFKIGKHIIDNNIPEALITFDTILKKGFDGQLFINGVGEHLRNLLVCKDPQTINLLELGEAVKNNYINQSKEIDQSTLLKALKLISDTDIHYKTSKNKRLLVEVCLMQLCSISFDGEKKNDLKILSPEVFADRQAPLIQPLAQPSKPKTTPSEPLKAPTPLPNMVEEPAPAKKKPVGKIKLGGFGIKNTLKEVNQDAVTGTTEETETEQPTNVAQDQFSLEQLLAAWDNYAQQIKQAGKESFFTTMKAAQPTILEDNKIGFQVVNAVQQLDFEKEQQDLLTFLRSALNNYKLLVELSLAQRKEGESMYTDTDKLKSMIKKNPALLQLVQKLNLEPEF